MIKRIILTIIIGILVSTITGCGIKNKEVTIVTCNKETDVSESMEVFTFNDGILVNEKITHIHYADDNASALEFARGVCDAITAEDICKYEVIDSKVIMKAERSSFIGFDDLSIDGVKNSVIDAGYICE